MWRWLKNNSSAVSSIAAVSQVSLLLLAGWVAFSQLSLNIDEKEREKFRESILYIQEMNQFSFSNNIEKIANNGFEEKISIIYLDNFYQRAGECVNRGICDEFILSGALCSISVNIFMSLRISSSDLEEDILCRPPLSDSWISKDFYSCEDNFQSKGSEDGIDYFDFSNSPDYVENIKNSDSYPNAIESFYLNYCKSNFSLHIWGFGESTIELPSD